MIVEPDFEAQLLVLITAYSVWDDDKSRMKRAYLEVTFRHGRPLAAYLYLPRRANEKSYRTVRAESGFVIDFSRGGRPIGIEITAPTKVSLVSLNNTLRSLGLPLVSRVDLAPLLAA